MHNLVSEIAVKSSSRTEMIDITSEVQDLVAKSKVKEGLCVVYCPHTTAAITVNEGADPSVQSDIINKLNEMVPANAGYTHSEGNSDAHIKSALMGNSRTLLVKEEKLLLGTWEAIFFCEFDGPRTRKTLVFIK